MNSLDDELSRRIEALRVAGLYRRLRRVDGPQSARITCDGVSVLAFCSNDYLGLAAHPEVKAAMVEAVSRYGAGAGASRLVCGSMAPWHALESALAEFKGTEAALVFGSGYALAVGVLPALLTRDDVVIVDRLVHASLVDGARLSGARLRVFAHNDLSDLEAKLQWAARQGGGHLADGPRRPRVLVVTESVFSMEGDGAPLREMVALKERYGAWLWVDEAHASGVYGERRRGRVDELGLGGRVEVQMGTLGKAFGAAGGYVCGSRVLVDYLLNRARSFIYSTAPVPAAAAAALAGLRLVQGEEGRIRAARLWDRVGRLRQRWCEGGRDLPGDPSPILPIRLGEASAAVAAAAALESQGILVPAIRYPTVPRGAARLRVTLSAAHEAGDVDRLADAWFSLEAAGRARQEGSTGGVG